MSHSSIVLWVACIFFIGLLVTLFFRSRARAARDAAQDAAVDALLAERFVLRRRPEGEAGIHYGGRVIQNGYEVAVPSGGRVIYLTYNDAQGSGLVLVHGFWDSGTGRTFSSRRVAGIFKPGDDTALLERVRGLGDVIVATAIEGGALVIWKGRPSRDSILAHLAAASAGEQRQAPSLDSVRPHPDAVSMGERKEGAQCQPAIAPAPKETPARASPEAEERALLDEILARPEDDTPRTRFAELAARRNDPRAELIRAQMLLRDLRRGGQMGMGEIQNTKRAAQLIQLHPEWSDPVLRLGAQSAQFRRGFVDEITVDAARFLTGAPALYEIAPILHVRFTGAKGKVSELTASPHIARLRSISLVENQLTDEDAAALAASPHLANLRWLDLSWNQITNRGVEALAASPRLGGLQYLGITSNPCDNPVDESDFLDETTQYWKYRPAGEALEAKVGHKINWLHPGSERWPPDVDMV